MKHLISIGLLLTVISCSGKSSNANNDALVQNSLPPAAGDSHTPSSNDAATVPLSATPAAPSSEADTGTAPISVNFLAKVGSEDLLCSDKSADAIARGQIFTDIRIFISNLTFIADDGTETRVALDVAPANLQYRDSNGNSIALLNFLEASCASSDATKTVKVNITGLLPRGHYTQVRFQLGLPYPSMDPNLASMPSALAPSDMGWMWEHFPADLQIEASNGTTKKVLNALTSKNKTSITLPIDSFHAAAGEVDLTVDLSKIFVSDAADFLAGLEATCNNNSAAITEASPHCAYAFKAFGLEVANPKAPYAQSVFSIVP